MTALKYLVGAAMLVGSSTAALAQTEIYMINCGDGVTGNGPAKHAELIAEWESMNDGFAVNLEYVPWGQCQEKSTTLAAAGNPPALAYMGSRTLKQLAINDLIMPMELSAEEVAAYAPPVLGTVSYDGQAWGAPVAFSTKALYWNKDLFEAAGLDPETAPTTWDEMYDMAKQVQDNTDANGVGLAAASFDNTMHQFLNYVYSNGGAVINDAGEIVFDSENNVQALEFYGKLAEVSQPGPLAYDRAKLRPLFSEGQVAMFISGPWERTLVGDTNWGVAPVPHGPMGESGTLLITDSLAVFKGSGVEEQARSLAKWLTNAENQMAYDLAAGNTPIYAGEATAGLIAEDPTWAPFLEIIPDGGPEPFLTDYVGLQDAINEAIQGVVLGEVDAATAVADAAAMLEDYK